MLLLLLINSVRWSDYRWQQRQVNCREWCWLPGRIWCESLRCCRVPSRAPRGWRADARRSSEWAPSRCRLGHCCGSPQRLWGWAASRRGRRRSWIWVRRSLASGLECVTSPASSIRSERWKARFDLCCFLLSPIATDWFVKLMFSSWQGFHSLGSWWLPGRRRTGAAGVLESCRDFDIGSHLPEECCQLSGTRRCRWCWRSHRWNLRPIPTQRCQIRLQPKRSMEDVNMSMILFPFR